VRTGRRSLDIHRPDKVLSVYNHGTSSSYEGVGLYSGAGYSGYLGCIGQGVKGPGVSGSPGLKVLSHKWLASC